MLPKTNFTKTTRRASTHDYTKGKRAAETEGATKGERVTDVDATRADLKTKNEAKLLDQGKEPSQEKELHQHKRR